MVINNSVKICWGVSITTGCRTIVLPVAYTQLYGLACILHFDNPTNQFVTCGTHKLTSFVINPNSNCLAISTWVSYVVIGC